MAQRPRKSFFGGRGLAQAGGRPWHSKKLQDLTQRTLTIRGRYTELEVLQAIVNAPTTWAAVPTASSPPSVSYGAAGNDTPDTSKLGGVAWKRYWFRGANGQPENTGGGRTLLQRADFQATAVQGPALGGGVNYNNNSGNSTEWWQISQSLLRSGQAAEDIGDFSNWGWGFTLTGRGFAFTGQGYTDFVVYVEESGVLKRCTYQTFPRNDIYAYVDFGTSATRNILLVIEPDSWSSEMLIPTTATMVPWSGWRTNKLTYSFLTDSYFQSINDTDGVALIEQVALLAGGHAVPHASSQGGSGYSSDNSDSNVRPFQFPHRLNRFSTPQPDAGFVFGGINDGWPTSNIAGGGTSNTAQAIVRTLQTIRHDNPSMLLVVGSPWSPNGPNGQTVGGKYQLINDYLQTVLATMPGPWIFINSLSGTWKTSKGTQRAAAEGPWITGTGNSGAPNGTGNADTYIGPDGTHPNDAGRRYLAEKISLYMHEAAASMLDTIQIFGGAFDASIFDPSIFDGSYTQQLAGVTQTATALLVSSGASATAAQTLAGVAQTATASAVASLVASQTLAGVTQTVTATVGAAATAAQTLAGVTQAATVSAGAAVVAIQTLTGVSQTATAVGVPSLSATQQLAGVTQTATAASAFGLIAAQTLATVTQTATLAAREAATATQQLAGVSQTATTAAVEQLVAAQTLAGVTQTATATVSSVLSIAAAQTLDSVTLASTAVARVVATATQTLDGVTQSATASHALASAAAAQTLAAVSQTATAQATAKATAAQTLDNVAQTATGTSPPLSGIFASQQLAGVTQTATATETVKAAATQTLLGVVSTATAAVLEKLQAAQTLASVSQSAAANHGQATLDAAQTLAGVTQTATAIGIKGITGAQVLDGVVQTATAVRISGFSGQQVLDNVIQLALVRHELSIETNARTYLVRAEDREMDGVHHEDRRYGIIAQLRDYIPADQSRMYDNAAP